MFISDFLCNFTHLFLFFLNFFKKCFLSYAKYPISSFYKDNFLLFFTNTKLKIYFISTISNCVKKKTTLLQSKFCTCFSEKQHLFVA